MYGHSEAVRQASIRGAKVALKQLKQQLEEIK